MKTRTVVVRLPEDVLAFLRKKNIRVSEYIRSVVEREVRRERLLRRLKRIRVKWKKKPSTPLADLIREDRDVLF